MAPKIRTIRKAVIEIKKIDPESAITENYIKKLCDRGEIPFLNAGNKTLVNMDELFKYFAMVQ